MKKRRKGNNRKKGGGRVPWYWCPVAISPHFVRHADNCMMYLSRTTFVGPWMLVESLLQHNYSSFMLYRDTLTHLREFDILLLSHRGDLLTHPYDIGESLRCHMDVLFTTVRIRYNAVHFIEITTIARPLALVVSRELFSWVQYIMTTKC